MIVLNYLRLNSYYSKIVDCVSNILLIDLVFYLHILYGFCNLIDNLDLVALLYCMVVSIGSISMGRVVVRNFYMFPLVLPMKKLFLYGN